MGKMKENPRYNVLSFRACDRVYFDVVAAVTATGKPLADYLLTAVEEKLARDRHKQLDDHLRAQGV